MFANQEQFEIRCEWGIHGLKTLAPADVTIIVDVLSFTTCVDIALSRKAVILPLPLDYENPEYFALEHSARLAGKRGTGKFSLSPVSLSEIPEETRLVLPSPNGSQLTFQSKSENVVAGCLRNAKAVAEYANSQGKTINVIPAGEKWNEDGSLRVAIEDLIGAGAIISFIQGQKSPEAEIASTAFQSSQTNLQQVLLKSSSGQELVERGFTEDVQLASQLNISDVVPLFQAPELVNGSNG